MSQLEIKKAGILAELGKYDEALQKVEAGLWEEPEQPEALFILGFIFLMKDKPSIAYQFTKRSLDLYPNQPAAWANLGKCLMDMMRFEEARPMFKKALSMDPGNERALLNLALIAQHCSEHGLAIELNKQILKNNPDQLDAKLNMGFCRLSLYQWKEGWELYNLNIGKLKDRAEKIYDKETRFCGEKGSRVVVYGDQGIGDEISFASCLPDLIRDSENVIIETERRLEGVFKRSFPKATVYGTRYLKESQDWYFNEKFDRRVPLGQLPQFYRNRDEDFPGTPYLIPHPQMRIQWKALLDSLGSKPKIGIAWTGGRKHTYQDRRSVDLQTLLPLFQFDAEWVSLQYKDTDGIDKFCNDNGVKIHHFKWGAENLEDYDQTIALISQLDLVISVTTTVVHAAGAIGKECWCMVPENAVWRYGTKGSKFHWADSVTLFRQKGKDWPVYELLGKLREKFDSR